MSDAELKVDIGSALPYVEEKLRGLFGRDFATLEERYWLAQLHDTALSLTSSVQCVGMHRPVPFDKIYQPTKIKVRSGINIQAAASFHTQNRMAQSIAYARSREIVHASVEQFLQSAENAIIFAGPGWGKTTFLHHIFRSKVGTTGTFAILITLRRPTAVADLERFAEMAKTISEKRKGAKILLLVDGYDEISSSDRRRVSEALLVYRSCKVGRFILSCRDFYQVFNLTADEVFLDGFDKKDKYNFAGAFLTAFESSLDARELVNDLEDREFTDFLSHPLMLALACIVKTSSASGQARSPLRLLERATDVLQYLWDEHKGIDRQATTNLDGRDRMQILKRIAFVAKSPIFPGKRAEIEARRELDRMTFDRLDPSVVLRETAQFYGILVPNDDGWEFVQRSVQDYLAARYWTESGEFAKLQRYEWSTRTAYAACLSYDSTPVILSALNSENGLSTVAEILGNAPNFSMKIVSRALLSYYSKGAHSYVIEESKSASVSGGLENDLLRLTSNRFLNFVVEDCCGNRSSTTDIVVGYCLAELHRRGLKLDFVSYDAAIKVFENPNFHFKLTDRPLTTLDMLRPGIRKAK